MVEQIRRNVLGEIKEYQALTTDSIDTFPTNCGAGSTLITIDPVKKKTINKYYYDGSSWSIIVNNVALAASNKLEALVALNAVTASVTSPELNLTGANSVKFYVEITGTGTIKLEALGSSMSGGMFVSGGLERYFSNSKSFILPCASDFIKVQLTILNGNPTVTVICQGLTGVAIEDPIPRYRDLGEIINTSNIAAGAVVASDAFYDLQWVRSLVISAKSSQQFDIQFLGLDTVGLGGAWATTLLPLNGPAGGVWIPLKISTVLGYSGKFIIKNVSASTATFANLKVQLLGV